MTWTGEVLGVLNDRVAWVVEFVVMVSGGAVCVVTMEAGWVAAVRVMMEALDITCLVVGLP